ncbi:N-acetylmuramoyl-L-alanine amidase [Bacteroides sp. AN502]|nr:N-acetylmuramoyl-L-alanine amidase [Caecibacteroides pullorum]MDC6280784.1 N-acetylmuramoyl-L-alanine amidase [Caecibacteroides pullorum]
MRTITLIILHCSATREGQSFGFEDCRRDHIRHRGFRDIGYHYYITRDGTVHRGRPLELVGAHCRNHNRHSIGICYEGGLDAEGRAKDTRTEAQKVSLSALVGELKERFPQALVVGHRELDPGKECPCFEVNKLRKCLEFYKNDLSLQKVKTCKT